MIEPNLNDTQPQGVCAFLSFSTTITENVEQKLSELKAQVVLLILLRS